MHFRFAILGALLLSAPLFALDLKGVEVGQHVDFSQLKAAFDFHPGLGIESSTVRCIGSCGWGYTLIAGGGADIGVTIDNQQLLEIRAVFKSIYFESISAALVAKFGKPARISHANAQTVAGAQLPVIIQTWLGAAGDELVVTNFADGANGALVLTSKAEADAKSARLKKAAGDI